MMIIHSRIFLYLRERPFPKLEVFILTCLVFPENFSPFISVPDLKRTV